MKNKLIPFIVCLIVSFSGFSQNTSIVSTPTDSITSLRNKTALAVVYTMYYQDSVIAVQKQEAAIWETKFNSQKTLTDSCMATSQSAFVLATEYKDKYDKLERKYRIKSCVLDVMTIIVPGLILHIILY